MELFFVLLVLDIWDVGIHEEGISSVVALEKKLFLLLQVYRLKFFEASGKVGFLLIFLCLLWFFRFSLLFVFAGRFTFFLLLAFLLHFFFDYAQIISLFLTGFVVDDGRRSVRVIFTERFWVVRSYFYFISGMWCSRQGGLFVPIQYNWIDDHKCL